MKLNLLLASSAALLMLTGCTQDYIPTVKDAKLEAYDAQKPLGLVLADYRGCAPQSQTWSQKTVDDNTIVTFACKSSDVLDFAASLKNLNLRDDVLTPEKKALLDLKDAVMRIHFAVSEDGRKIDVESIEREISWADGVTKALVINAPDKVVSQMREIQANKLFLEDARIERLDGQPEFARALGALMSVAAWCELSNIIRQE